MLFLSLLLPEMPARFPHDCSSLIDSVGSTTRPTPPIPISQPGILEAVNLGYPATPFSGSMRTLAEIVDLPQVCVPFVMEDEEQTL